MKAAVQRYFVVRHADSKIYLALAPARSARRWSRDDVTARRFASEDEALAFIAASLNGRGRAVEVIAPAER